MASVTDRNHDDLTIWVTDPRGEPALLLAEMDIVVRSVEGDEGPVDRYLLGQRTAVERRTGASFLNGIVDKTLFTSAIYLREHFEVPILLVEGEFDYRHTSFNPQAVRGALSSMMLGYGLSVLHSPNVDETVALLAMIARHEQAGIPEISLVPKRKAIDLPDMQRRVIEMLPGCGRVMARDLLQHFGSVNRIASAAVAELCQVRGVGPKRAAELYQILNAEYGAVDTERDLEDAIHVAPKLLFRRPVEFLDRQHYIYTEGKERHIVDLVFTDPITSELILVELKRGRLNIEHEQQLRRYLDNASRSSLLRSYVDQGSRIRGILATIEPCDYDPQGTDVSVRIIDRQETIKILKQLRARRLGT